MDEHKTNSPASRPLERLLQHQGPSHFGGQDAVRGVLTLQLNQSVFEDPCRMDHAIDVSETLARFRHHTLHVARMCDIPAKHQDFRPRVFEGADP